MNPRFPPLDEEGIRRGLSAENTKSLQHLTVFESIESTNLYLQKLPAGQANGRAVFTDHQTSGRGRRGRNWHSPPGCNIYMSLGWLFPSFAENLGLLPLVVAIALTRTVRKAGVADAGIKWPNDIQVNGKKLAGILVETRTNSQSGCLAVIGVGMNVRMPKDKISSKEIQQAWTDVCSCRGEPVDTCFRDALCSELLNELLSCLVQFERCGFEPFRNEWKQFDLLQGKNVTVSGSNGPVSGKAVGISARGGLLVSGTDSADFSQVKEFLAGEVSVRNI